MVILSDYWSTLQISLIPFMEQVVETRLTEKEKRLVAIMDVIGVEKHLDHPYHYGHGRMPYDIRSMARAFIARAALNLSQTKMLREMLLGSVALRAICGFESRERVPSESVFSHNFAVLARSGYGDKTHEAIDVEGYEPNVLRGAKRVIARDAPSFLYEYNHLAAAAGWSCEDIEKIIQETGRKYKYSVLHQNGELTEYPPKDGEAVDIFAECME